MSAVKRKLKNTKLIQKCQIIRQIEKKMTNKEASEKFGVQKTQYPRRWKAKINWRFRTKLYRRKENARLWLWASGQSIF